MSHQLSADGVCVTRRTTLHGAWALPALWALGRRARETDDIDGFLRDWSERAHELVSQAAPNEDAHLFELCATLARMDPLGFPRRKKDAYENDGLTTGPIHGDAAFLVLELELEPGAVIRAHNHVGWSFISYGVEGETAVRHFEPSKGAPGPEEVGAELEIREVSSGLLTAGRTSTLTRSRANIHWFRAGEKRARMIDFGVHFTDPGDGPETFSVLEVDEEPFDPARRVYKAKWLGNIYAKKED